MKKWVVPGIVSLAIVAGGAFLWWQMSLEQASLKLHGHRYHIVAVMRTEAELQKGLSGTDSLSEDQAMVFAFPGDGKWGIWMKDMQYPIDIVWLDSGRTVVHMVKNAQPSSYPSTTFRPEVNSRYVIELPSGTIERTGITKGDPAGMPSGI